MLIDNSWEKPPQWFARHAYARRGCIPPSDWQRAGQILKNVPLELQTIVANHDRYGLPEVRCIVGKYSGVDITQMDSGTIISRPGAFTPPQLNSSAHLFEEIPLCGRMIFLGVRDGKFITQLYDISPRHNAPRIPLVKQGDIMRWYICQDQHYQPSKFEKTFWPDSPPPNIEIFEHVTPGFASANLATVPEGATSVGDISIPTEFWKTCQLLKHGDEAQVIANTPAIIMRN